MGWDQSIEIKKIVQLPSVDFSGNLLIENAFLGTFLPNTFFMGYFIIFYSGPFFAGTFFRVFFSRGLLFRVPYIF